MARKSLSFAEEVEAMLRKGEVYQDMGTFAQELGVLMNWQKVEAMPLLVRMSSLIKEKKDAEKTSSGRQEYRDKLAEMAQYLHTYQVMDRDWIETNIFPLPKSSPDSNQIEQNSFTLRNYRHSSVGSRLVKRSSSPPSSHPSAERGVKKTKIAAENIKRSVVNTVPHSSKTHGHGTTTNIGKKTRRRIRLRKKACMVPGCLDEKTSDLRRHAYTYHIPEVFHQFGAYNPMVIQGRIKALLQVGHWLLGGPISDLQNLVDLVNLQECSPVVSPTDSWFSDEQLEDMKAVSDHLQLPLPKVPSLSPVNHVAVLLHWRVLLLLAALLQPDEQKMWLAYYEGPERISRLATTTSDVRSYPQAVDSHFYLDRLREYTGMSGASVQDIINCGRIEEERRVQLVGVVAAYCDPDTYPTVKDLDHLPADVFVAIGYHPKLATQSRQFQEQALDNMKALLRCPRVVAVGEIGIDHADPEEYWHLQNELIRQILPLVRPDQVIVIHCREIPGNNGYEACQLLLHLLKGLPRRQKIHVHSFMADYVVAKWWLEVFPETVFGFNRSVQDFRGSQVEALVKLKEEQLLLETDAPHFTKASTDKYSAPNQIYDVAEMVANHRRVKVSHILRVTKHNALRLYCGTK